MKYKLNLKLFLRSVGVGAVLTLLVHFLHGYQERRLAGVWVSLALAAEAKGQSRQAAACLERYLSLRPEDEEAREKYALDLAKAADAPRSRWEALAVLERTIVREPGRSELRRAAIDLAMSAGRFADAREHLEQLIARGVEDAKIEQQLGECVELAGELPAAAGWYKKAIQHDHARVSTYVRLANLLRRELAMPKEADAVFDRMSAANPRSPSAHLALSARRKEQGNWEEAWREATRTIELAPQELDGLLAAAEVGQRAGRAEETRRLLASALELRPRQPELYAALARLDFGAKHPDLAMAWLERGLEAIPGHTEFRQMLCDLLVGRGETAKAAPLIEELKKAGDPLALAGYWDARIMMRDGRYRDAVGILEKIRLEQAASLNPAYAIDEFLGQCYGAMDDVDAQLRACRRAVAERPESARARSGLAGALLAAGNPAEACAEYRRVTCMADAPPGSWLALAGALLIRSRQVPPAERDWREVEQSIDEADREGSVTPASLRLRAEVKAECGQLPDALSLLRAAVERDPRQTDCWLGLAQLEERNGRPQVSLQVFRDAQSRAGNSIELALEQIRYWRRHPGASADHALRELESAAGRFGEADRYRLLWEMARTYASAGNDPAAKRLATELARRRRDDLGSRLLLVECSLRAGQDSAAAARVAEIRDIEGGTGAHWRCAEAARCLEQARKGNTQALEQARIRLSEAAKLRPGWARVSLLQGEIDEMDGQLDRAADAYLQAVDAGVREPALVHRLIRLLLAQGRELLAEHVLRKVEGAERFPPALAKTAAKVALVNRNMDEAARLAREAVAGSTDYREHLWLADVLVQAGRPGDADAVLEAAVTSWKATPETWLAWVRRLAATKRADGARAVMERARQALGPDQLCRLLGPAYEALGEYRDAERFYLAALQNSPEDFSLCKQAAGFYARAGKNADAEKLLRRLSRAGAEVPPELAAGSRRQLALSLAARGARFVGEALELLDRNAVGRAPTILDQRARARVLASRPDRLAEALTALNSTIGKAPFSPEDQLLRAELEEAAGHQEQARQAMLALLSRESDNPLYLRHYVRCLTRWGEARQAEEWLARLLRLDPGSPETREIRTEVAKLRAGDFGP